MTVELGAPWCSVTVDFVDFDTTVIGLIRYLIGFGVVIRCTLVAGVVSCITLCRVEMRSFLSTTGRIGIHLRSCSKKL